MTVKMPYFMENKEWYYYDEEEYCWKLTDKAPKEAIESYKQYYENLDELCSICYDTSGLVFRGKLSLAKPYFMTNKDWFYHDVVECRIKLTDKASAKAEESYNKFYQERKGLAEVFNHVYDLWSEIYRKCFGEGLLPRYQVAGNEVFADVFNHDEEALYKYCVLNHIKWEHVLDYHFRKDVLY